jgi:glycosyltransferase involved in cell wall biosynthesis
VVTEIFNWGVYGGIGSLTRTIGSELAKKGVEVYVLMHKTSPEQRTIEQLDGMTVIGLDSWKEALCKICDADIYHSEDPSYATYLMQKYTPQAKHLITFQNPRTLNDEIRTVWSLLPEWQNPAFRYPLEIKLKYLNYLLKKTVSKADRLTCQAKYIVPYTMSLYNLKETPSFLPNPVEVPQKQLKKADKPTVCFLGRWDKVKRVELFLRLAREFKDVTFIAAGAAGNKQEDLELRQQFADVPNLVMPGVVFGEQKNAILEKSWILVNTSSRECLPVSFLEACAYKCAILSSNNPDDFAQQFGYYAKSEDYANGLRFLLDGNMWMEKGLKGHQYVKDNHELNRVIDKHLLLYSEMLG